MKKEITVGFLTSQDPTDKRSFSGIYYSMYMSLRNEFTDVVPLGPVGEPKLVKGLLYLLDKVHRILFKKAYNRTHNILKSLFYAYHLEKKIRERKIDVIFAPASSTEIAYLNTKIPICYLSDTSFNQIQNYYKEFSDLSSLSLKESNLIEQRAINNSKTQVYSSNWASNHVIDYYKAKPSNVYVVKFGANLDYIPSSNDVGKCYYPPIKLLFLGVDWERKGGIIAYEALKILLKNKYDVILTVVGCIPPVTDPNMLVIPFLNKNLKEENEKLIRLLIDSHILLVPTRADCTPIVFCEANAFGIPVITTDTGGVSSIVENGVNGYALPMSATASHYAEIIQSILDNHEKLRMMSKLSRAKFEHELNWSTWGKQMKDILLLTMRK